LGRRQSFRARQEPIQPKSGDILLFLEEGMKEDHFINTSPNLPLKGIKKLLQSAAVQRLSQEAFITAS
jgi:hypothetical protein